MTIWGILNVFFKKTHKKFGGFKKMLYLCTRKQEQGTLADRLGNGLQNRVEQFDSARYLLKVSVSRCKSTTYGVLFLTFWRSLPQIVRNLKFSILIWNVIYNNEYILYFTYIYFYIYKLITITLILFE